MEVSAPMRDLLIRHLDGQRVLFDHAPHSKERRVATMCITQRFLDLVGTPGGDVTLLTDKGRELLSGILADYADALARAGYGMRPQEERAAFVPAVESNGERFLPRRA